MVEIHRKAVVPYSTREMYALVNDIESYPLFLPWCNDAKILERENNRLMARLSMKIGRFGLEFTTENTMRPERHIEMRLVEGPFRHLAGNWKFEPRGENSCAVAFDLRFEFKNRLLRLALSSVFNKIMAALVDSFVRRAEQLYGRR